MATQLKDFSKVIAATGVFSLASLGMVSTANAAIIKLVDATTFGSTSGLIAFSEKPLGTTNPVYTPSEYGGGVNAPIVSFGGFFTGQTVGAAPNTGVVTGTPTGTLSLSGTTRIVSDTFNPTSPVLSGSPTFNGPVSILFSRNVSAVGLDGGFFDAIGGTAITAFDRNGVSLGSVVNTIAGNPANPSSGIEFLGLVTEDGSNQIAGLQFSIVGAEPAGFAIDNLRFSTAVNTPIAEAVPEPFTIVGTLIGGTAALRMRKKLKSND